MAHGCQSSPASAEGGPTPQASTQLPCPTAWGNHSSTSGKKQQRGKQTHPPSLEADVLCWAGCSPCPRPGLGEQHMLEKAGFPAAVLSAGGPDLPFAHIKGNAQLTRGCFAQPDHLQGTVFSPCARGVNLSHTPYCEHGGRDRVLGWEKKSTGVKQEGVEQHPPLPWADGLRNAASPKAPGTLF